MKTNARSICVACSVPTSFVEPLSRAVRHALSLRRARRAIGALAVGLAIGSAGNAFANPFPPVFPLAKLLPSGGGDGSRGFVLTGIDADDDAGRSVSGAGDVNGDGIDDLIVGALHADPRGDPNAGESYVVFGSTHGFPAIVPLAALYPAGGGDGSRGFVLTGIDRDDYSGISVSTAGDVNGDGIDDLIIGASQADTGGYSAGESYVVFGSTQGFSAIVPLGSLYPAGGGDGSRGFVLTGTDSGDRVGISVSTAGDVNGDGIDDLIVGADGAGRGYLPPGTTYVVFGSTQGFPAIVPLASLYPSRGGDGSRGFVLTGIRYDYSGRAVSAAGDVNGDGIDDLIIGAGGGDPGGDYNAGESFVVFGSARGFPANVQLGTLYPAGGGDGSRGFVLTGIDEYDFSGGSVSAAGDVNDDGIDDLIVGANGAAPGGDEYAGESYVVFGSTQGFPAIVPLGTLYPAGGGDGSRGFVLTGIDRNDNSGDSVSGAGDVNGDGIDDLIVGAPADQGPSSAAGESYVVFGSTERFPAIVPLGTLYPAGGGDGSRGFVLTGIDAYDVSGRSVSGAGDVNGDGIDDVIVGAPGASPAGNSDAGESYVVFGRAEAP